MKKTLKIFVVFVLVITMLAAISTTAAAEKIGPGLYGENIEWYWDENTKTLSILGSDKMVNYSDPSRRAWDSIANEVEHLIIGDEVTYIGSYSFYDMENLEDAVIGSGVTKIDDYAFKYCYKLSSDVDLTNVEYVGKEAFLDTDVSSVTFGNKTTFVGNAAFMNNDGITTLNIPSGIEFETAAFNKCSKLKSVYIDSDVSMNMFYECKELETVVIGSNVDIIGSHGFYLNESLINLTISEGVETIKKWSFNNALFTNVTIPSTVDTIEYASMAGLNPTYLVFFEGNCPTTIDDSVAGEGKYHMYIYKSGTTGWSGVSRAKEWSGEKVNDITLDLSEGNIYMYELDDGTTGCVCGDKFYLSDSNKVTITQSTDVVSNKITVVNGNINCTLKNINMNHIGEGLGCITVLSGASIELNIPEGTHSIINNAGDTLDGYYASGIWVDEFGSLTINGSGTLDLYGSGNRSGITILHGANAVINGGNIYSKAGDVAAGICISGYKEKKATLTINGGNITAIGGIMGAGIKVSEGVTLTINGGNITAIGGEIGGSGIGGDVEDNPYAGTIIINGGTVYARAGGESDDPNWECGIKPGDIGIGGGGIGEEYAIYLYISKNASVDARYIGSASFNNANDIFHTIEIEDLSVIKNLESYIKPFDGIVYTISIASATKNSNNTISVEANLNRTSINKGCLLIFATYDASGRFLGMETKTIAKGSSSTLSVSCTLNNSNNNIATIKLMSVDTDGNSFAPIGNAATANIE